MSSTAASPATVSPSDLSPDAGRGTVVVETTLDAAPDAVWRAVNTPAAFRFVTQGLVSLDGVDEVDTWGPGASVAGKLRILGVPFSQHRITVESIDDDRRALQSDEAGGPIRSWRHLITVDEVPGDPDRCRYTDRIEIDAGVLTPAVVAFAHVFYRARQRRWRALAPVLAGVCRPPGGD
jgi:ligand-binding SRPBCC domain-containing protein